MKPYQETEAEKARRKALAEQTRAAVAGCEGTKPSGLAQKLWSKAGLGKELAAGLLGVVCAAGLQTVHQVFEEEVTERVGKKGKHNRQRDAKRHGYDFGEVSLGGRRLQILRPRMRWLHGAEIPLTTYLWATERNILNQMTYDRVLSAGVSTRHYTHTLEPISARQAHRPRSVSKSTINRRFIALTRKALDLLLSRDLSEIKAVALMIDGIYVAGRVLVVAIVIDIDGYKHVVAVREGATENKIVVKDLLADLVARGLKYETGLLAVIDGSKALAAALQDTFGDKVFIQRCVEHKVRNVEAYLHKEERSWVGRTIRRAVKRTSYELALRDLKALVKRLEETNLEAAKSLHEGMEELLTIHRLGVGQLLARTLRTTNAIESMNDIIRVRTRLVKHWRDGDMRERWVAAAMLEAESQFRRIQGWKELPALAAKLYAVTVLKQPLEGGDIREIAA